MVRRTIALAVAALVTTFAAGWSAAVDTAPDPNDHAALAAAYSSEAKALRQKAAEHELMLQRYESAATSAKGVPFPKATLVQHCRKLVASYEQAASSAEALSKMEGELAAAKPSK